MKINRWRKITDKKSNSKKKNMDRRKGKKRKKKGKMRRLKNRKSMGKRRRMRKIARSYRSKISHRRAQGGKMLIIKKSKIIAK
jgi:hypothetical protein